MSMITLCLAAFMLIMLATLMSYTPWAQQHAKWLTNIFFYCVVGLIFGVLLVKVCFTIGETLAK